MRGRVLLVIAATASVLAASLAACGSSTSLELAGGALSSFDAGCETTHTDVDGSSDSQAPPPDVVLFDHGINGPDAFDAPLSQCTSDQDCDGWATCQHGLCCSGTLTNGVCACGETPGCDLRHTCCTPFNSSTGKPECVDDCESQCGCTSPPR
jgi:hypothetical protein